MAHETGMIPGSPLAGGVLTSKHTRADLTAATPGENDPAVEDRPALTSRAKAASPPRTPQPFS